MAVLFALVAGVRPVAVHAGAAAAGASARAWLGAARHYAGNMRAGAEAQDVVDLADALTRGELTSAEIVDRIRATK